MSDNMRTALISGITALVVGSFAFLGTVLAVNNENDRIDERLDEEARGAARSLISELNNAAAFSLGVVGDDLWLKPDQRVIIELPASDMRLVNSRLTNRDYARLTEGLNVAGNLANTYQTLSLKERRRTLSRQDHNYVLEEIHALAVAIDALGRLAEVEKPGQGLQEELSREAPR
jgi:hypothetical protein